MNAVVTSAEGINELIPTFFFSLQRMILAHPDRLRLTEAKCGWLFEARTAVISWQRFDTASKEWVVSSRLTIDRSREEEHDFDYYVLIQISGGGMRFFSSHEQLFSQPVQEWLVNGFGV